MRVGFDVSPLVQTRAGTARHVRALLSELEAVPDVEIRRLRFPGRSRAATVARDVGWYLAALPLAARGVDVLHCPTFRAPLRSSVPFVVTVHDLAVLKHPELFNRWTRRYSALVVPRVVRAAARVIAVSEFTRREVVETLRVPEDRVRVVRNAVDPIFTPEGPSAQGEFVLAVGTLEPRKNLARVVQAARRVGVELRVVGALGWGDVDIAADGVRWLGDVPDGELAELYRGALCFVYPSLYEGFGLPVLEAMACGAPVVTAAGGALEELADGAAVLVDPLDPAAIADGLARADARRDELRRRGIERAQQFTWDAAAEATAAVYREVAS